MNDLNFRAIINRFWSQRCGRHMCGTCKSVSDYFFKSWMSFLFFFKFFLEFFSPFIETASLIRAVNFVSNFNSQCLLTKPKMRLPCCPLCLASRHTRIYFRDVWFLDRLRLIPQGCFWRTSGHRDHPGVRNLESSLP